MSAPTAPTLGSPRFGSMPQASRTVAADSPTDHPGATIWLTGLPSAGKSTIAVAVAQRLRAAGRRVEVLDGDAVRPHLSAGLGFDRASRDTNVRRIGWVAHLLARHGVLVLVPVIAPYTDSREAVRALHEEADVPYIEVHVATPVEITRERDVKGLYARQARGEITGLTGVDDPYETPVEPELTIHAHGTPVEDSAALVLATLTTRGLA